MTDKELNLPPPAAPKGPFADYSAEEVEAYALEYALAVLADRAQQGEPVVIQQWRKRPSDAYPNPPWYDESEDAGRGAIPSDIWAANYQVRTIYRAATKAAAPADAPPELVELGTKMAAWLYGLSKSSLPYESWATRCKEFSDAWDDALNRRAFSVAAPTHPSEAKAGESQQ